MSFYAEPTTCPHCESSEIKFNKTKGYWRCQNEACELTFEGPQPAKDPEVFRPQKIFLSYGHDENAVLVDLIRQELVKAGHTVWVDHHKIKTSDDWRESITRGIRESDRVLSFLSKHSVREPGVCLDEIGIALSERHGAIATLLVEPVNEVKAPPSVSHIQFLDLSNWKSILGKGGKEWIDWLDRVCNEILDVIRRNSSFAGEMDDLRSRLLPLSQYALIGSLIKEPFFGRKWVFEAIEDWRLNKQDEGMFLLLSGPGMGKSMISAHLAHFNKLRTVAYHFCRWNQPESMNAKSFVLNLAYQIAARSPSYRLSLRDRLQRLEVEKPLLQRTAFELFNSFIVESAYGVIDGGQSSDRLLIVIDALDEAPEIAELLFDLYNQPKSYLPSWLAVFATSRPEQQIPQNLTNNVYQLSLEPGDDRNQMDLRLMLEPLLTTLEEPIRGATEDQLLTASGGSIFYLALIKRWHGKAEFNLSNVSSLPVGLEGLFHSWFDRQFANSENAWSRVKPLLRLLCASPYHLPLTVATNILGWTDEDDQEVIGTLGGLVFWKDGELRLSHATFSRWLTTTHGRYRIGIQQSTEQLIFYINKAIPHLLETPGVQYEHLAFPILLSRLDDDRFKELIVSRQINDAHLLQLAEAVGKHMDLRAREASSELYRCCLRGATLAEGNESPAIVPISNKLALCLTDLGKYSEARVLQEASLGLLRSQLGEEHPDTIASLINISASAIYLGDYRWAKEQLVLALEFCKKVHGNEHPDTISVTVNLSVILYRLGNYKEALDLQEKALELTKSTTGFRDVKGILIMSHLSSTLSALGDIQKSVLLQEETLVLSRKCLGSEHSYTQLAMNNLATGLLDTGKYHEAKNLLEELIALSQRTLGEEHPNTLLAMSNLANSLSALGKVHEALKLHQRVLAKRQINLGEEHPESLESMNCVANCYSGMGEHRKAQAEYENVFKIRQRIFGEDNPDTFAALANISNCLYEQGNYLEAKALYERILDWCQRFYGTDHQETIKNKANLAASLYKLGEFHSAKVMQEKVLFFTQRVFGVEHLDTLSAMVNLSATYNALEEYQSAKALTEQAVQTSLRFLGEEHRTTILAMRDYAYSLSNLKHHEQALNWQERALALSKKILGEEHPDTIGIMINLSRDFFYLNNYQQAIVLIKRALDLCILVLGRGHPTTLLASSNLSIYQSKISSGQTVKNFQNNGQVYFLQESTGRIRIRFFQKEWGSLLESLSRFLK